MTYLKKGSFLVEALTALIVITFAVGIAFVSAANLMRNSNQNAMLITLAEVLFNEAEIYLSANPDTLASRTYTKTYNGNTYTINFTLRNEYYVNTNFSIYRRVSLVPINYQRYPVNQILPLSHITFPVAVIRVTDSKGRYIETEIVLRRNNFQAPAQ